MKYLLGIIFCVFVSCVSERGKDIALSVWLPCDSLDVGVGTPTLIKKVGNVLFVNNSFSDLYLFDAIDIVSDSILYSFAAKGQGPDDFLQIASMDVYKQGNEWFLMLFDNMKRQCVTYSVDSLNQYKGNCQPVRKQDLPFSSRFLELYRLNDYYLATGRTAKKFTLLDKDSLCYVRSCGEYLIGNSTDTDSMSISKANYGRQYLSEDRTKLLGVIFMSGTLSLYSADADSVSKVWEYTSSGFEYEKRGVSVYPKTPMGYLAAGFLGETVLGLYSGELKGNSTNYGQEFHLLDLDGRLCMKYAIPPGLYNFCTDSNDSLIYTISYNPDPKIMIYNYGDIRRKVCVAD